MMDEESTKRYCLTSNDLLTLTPAEVSPAGKVQAGQEVRGVTVVPQRKADEPDDPPAEMATRTCCSFCFSLRDKCPRPQGLIGVLITKTVLFALLFGVVWSITGSECLPGRNLFGLVILFITSVLGGKLVGMIKFPTLPPLPPLLGMLLAGLLLRNIPYITDAVYIDTHWSAALRNIALSIILTRAGLGLNPSALQRLKAVCLRIAISPCMVEACTIALVSHFLLGLPWVWGFILGFVLAAVSPAVVVPSMLLLQKEGYGVEKGIPTLLMAAGSFDDILAITGFSTCLGIAFSTGSTWMNILKGLLEVVGGMVAGLVLGLFLCCFPCADQEDLVLTRTLMLLGLSIFSLFFSHVVGFAGAGGLCTLVLAFMAALGWRTDKAPVAAMVGRSWDVFQPLLFGLIGAEITIATLSPSTVGLGLACIGVGLVIRLLITFLVVHFGGFTLKEKLFISVAWLPKATVQAAIGSKALDMAREEGNEAFVKFGLDVLTLAVLAILTTAPIGALGIGLAGPRLLVQQVKANDTEGGASSSSSGVQQSVTYESMLLAGLLLRNIPYITDAVYIDTHWSAALRNIALSIILTRAGLGLNPSALQRLKAVCLRIAISPCMVEACTIALVSHFLLGLPWVWGFILGFVLAAVSPAVVVPSMLLLQKEGYGVEKGIPTLLMAAGSFDDILAITGFSTCLGIAFSTGSTWMNILKGLLEVVGGMVAGLVLGLFLCCFPCADQEDLVLTRTLMLLGLSIFSLFFSHVVGFAGAGGPCTLVLAFMAALGWRTDKAPVAAMVGRSWDVFQPLLFGLIGAEITIATLSPSTVGLGLACIGVGLVIRLLITFLVVHFGGFTLKEKLFISVAWLPKATVQAAIGSKALDMAREEGNEAFVKFGLDVLTLAVLAILTTAPIGALGIGLAGPRLLVQQVKANDTEGGASSSSSGVQQSVTYESKL